MAAIVGEQAPEFTLRNQRKEEVSLASLRGRKTLVVFIPFPFTRICDGELCDLRDNLAQLSTMDANVVVITCSTIPSNGRWAEENSFEFPVLSDFWPHGAAAQAYGCFNETFGVPMRATFVLDAEGIVREIIATDSLGEPRHVSSYHASLTALDAAY